MLTCLGTPPPGFSFSRIDSGSAIRERTWLCGFVCVVFVLVVESAGEFHRVDVGSAGWVAGVDGFEGWFVVGVGSVPRVFAAVDITDSGLVDGHGEFLHEGGEAAVSFRIS
jgi:hypothetical protein